MNRKRCQHEPNGGACNNAPCGAEEAAREAQAEGLECERCAEEQKIAGEMQRLLQESEKAARERDEFINLAQRVQADFDNYRRRNQNAREDAYTEGARDTLAKFLPVLDNLERAAEAQGGVDALREGVLLVLRQLVTVFANAGVQEIPAQGCAFDPNVHNAAMLEPVDGCESGRVVAVLQKGYTHSGKVLRHCMVKVSQ